MMMDIVNIFNATSLKLFLTATVVCVALLLITGRQLIRRIQLSRKITGPSLWEVWTVYGRQLLSPKIGECFRELTERYNYKPWGFWGGTNYIVVISDPDTIREAFKSKNFATKSDLFYNGVNVTLGKNMLALSGPEWKRHRSAFNPGFKKSILDHNLATIYKATKEAIANMKQNSDGADFDMRHLIEKMLVFITVWSFCDRNYHADDQEIGDLLSLLYYLTQKVFDLSTIPAYYYFHYLYLEMNKFKRHRETLKNIRKTICSMVRRAEQQNLRDDKGQDATPLAVIMAENTRTQTMTEDEIVSTLFVILTAAIDTTSTSLNACICLLAMHPQVQQRAAEEVRSAFGESSRPITTDDLVKLEYLERVIKESLRLFPPASGFMRVADEDTDLTGTVVPKGALLMINATSLHRNPSVYKDPLKFNPDRFLPENQQDQHRHAFIPFSAGPRDCIGRVHAMMTMKIFLSSMLRQYKIFPGHGLNSIEDIKTKWHFTLHMDENFVRLVPLNGNSC